MGPLGCAVAVIAAAAGTLRIAVARGWSPPNGAAKKSSQMATIATPTTKTDGSFEGALAALSGHSPIAVVPNARKAKETEPDFRIISRRNGYELGAGWAKSAVRPATNISQCR